MAPKGGKALGLAVGALLATGCESPRYLQEADCQAVGEALAAAWRADANQAIIVAESEQYRRFVAEEAKSIAQRWLQQCRRQLGRPVDAGELRCLRRAKRVADVSACAERYGEPDSGGG